MASGQQPDRTDLAAAGLDGVCTDFFNPRGDGDERRRQQSVAGDPAPAQWDSSPAAEAA
jgi:hypothetical protein